jgi:hypothetical protein
MAMVGVTRIMILRLPSRRLFAEAPALCRSPAAQYNEGVQDTACHIDRNVGDVYVLGIRLPATIFAQVPAGT